MKKLFCILLAALCALTISAAALADEDTAAVKAIPSCADDVSIFDFVNVYSESITQPGLNEAELNALISAHDETLETEYATYTVTQTSFDGRTAYVLARATPKDGVLLMSDYMWFPEDRIPLADNPDSTETFGEKAERENRRIVVAGMYVEGLGAALTDEAGFSEMYFSDGTMLLFGRFEYNIATDAARDLKVKIREYPLEEERVEQYMTVRLEPSAELTVASAEGEYRFGKSTLNSVELMRSQIGMSARLSGVLDADASENEIALVSQGFFKLGAKDGELFELGGGIMFFDENGTPVFSDDAKGGYTFISDIPMAAGTAMPGEVNVALQTFTDEGKELVGGYEIPLTVRENNN